MKKFSLIIYMFIIIIFLGACKDNNETNNTIKNNSEENISYNYTVSNVTSNTENNNVIEVNRGETNPETELSSFSTKIYTPNDSGRQNNITLSCSKVNGTIVKSGETFSFCDTVGKATPEAGYQKADIFDKDGNTIKGYGGGNCQISSTLYNAVLEISSLTVVERHEHSKEVYYVPLGKDAAVAYGSIDFKFRNDSDNDIKIYCSNTTNSVDVKIVEL